MSPISKRIYHITGREPSCSATTTQFQKLHDYLLNVDAREEYSTVLHRFPRGCPSVVYSSVVKFLNLYYYLLVSRRPRCSPTALSEELYCITVLSVGVRKAQV